MWVDCGHRGAESPQGQSTKHSTCSARAINRFLAPTMADACASSTSVQGPQCRSAAAAQSLLMLALSNQQVGSVGVGNINRQQLPTVRWVQCRLVCSGTSWCTCRSGQKFWLRQQGHELPLYILPNKVDLTSPVPLGAKCAVSHLLRVSASYVAADMHKTVKGTACSSLAHHWQHRLHSS